MDDYDRTLIDFIRARGGVITGADLYAAGERAAAQKLDGWPANVSNWASDAASRGLLSLDDAKRWVLRAA